MMIGHLPVFLLGPTDRFVTFALRRLGPCKTLTGCASSLQGVSTHNQIKYHGSENRSSCLTLKGNLFDGKKKNTVSGQLKMTFCLFSSKSKLSLFAQF